MSDSDESLLLDHARTGRAHALDTLIGRHWPEAYRLALRLLGDAAGAEDVAQEAFVKLIRGAKSFEPGRSFLPWFRSLVLNAARDEKRSTRARRRREERVGALAPATVEPAGERAVVARELEERLASLDVELSFPLVLHYYEGRSHEEVGATLGCPTGTASSRIRRGLEQLRESFAGAGASLALEQVELALQGSAQRPVAVPPAPSGAALEALAAKTAVGGLALGATLKTLALYGLFAAALTGAVLVGLPGNPPGNGAPPTAADSREPGAAPVTSASDGGARSGETPTSRTAGDASGAAPVATTSDGASGAVARASFDFLVHDTAGNPVAGAEVELRVPDARDRGEPEAIARLSELGFNEWRHAPGKFATTDAGGRASLDPKAFSTLEAGDTIFAVARWGLGRAVSAPFVVGSSRASAIDLTLRQPAEPAPGTGSLLVTVLGPRDVPVAGQPLDLRCFVDAPPETRDGWTRGARSHSCVPETDELGRFVLQGLVPAGYRLYVRREGWRQLDPGCHVTILAGDASEVTVRLEVDRKAAVRGRVMGASGPVPSGAAVRLITDTGTHGIQLGEDGRFHEDLDEPGNYSVVAVAPGLATVRASVAFKGEPVDVGDLVLGAGAVVSGRLLGAQGAPVTSATIALTDAAESPVALVETGADGRFSVAGVPAGTYSISDLVGEGRSRVLVDLGGAFFRFLPRLPLGSVVVPAAGEASTGDLRIPGAPLSGHVVGPDGRAVADAELELFNRAIGRFDRAKTDAEGAYQVADLPGGSWQLMVRAGELALAPQTVVVGDAPVTLDLVLGATGSVVGELTGPAPRIAKLTSRFVDATLKDSHGAFGAGADLDLSNGFKITGLAPGVYLVSLSATSVEQEVEVTAGQTTHVALALPDAVGSVRVRVSGYFTGKRHVYATVSDGKEKQLADLNGTTGADGSGDFVVTEVPAGTWEVGLFVGGIPSADATSLWLNGRATVLAGETVEVPLTGPGVEATGSLAGRVELAARDARLTIEATGAGLSASVEPRADGTFTISDLPPGSYKVFVATHAGAKGDAVEVTVSKGARADAGLLASPK